MHTKLRAQYLNFLHREGSLLFLSEDWLGGAGSLCEAERKAASMFEPATYFYGRVSMLPEASS
ncbi:MAG: hypothetical protein ACE5JO_12775, partial [Candidatus Binatia bacterium]